MTRAFIPPQESDIPLHGWWRPYHSIHRERIRAHFKHDDNGQSMERKSWDDPAWLSVLVEEVGEVARWLCEQRHGNITGTDHLYEELVQVAAMTTAWMDAINLEQD